MKPSHMLAEHGTTIITLKPSSLVQAAQADIARRRRNTDPQTTTFEHYAFHRAHVKKAASAAELISLAAAEPDLGSQSAKYNTRLIYSDAELLAAAKALVTA